MATATTRIVPRAKADMPCTPARNMPDMAMMTVSPEMSTERPEVAAAARARLLAAPGGTFLAFALQVKHRVVDAHREPD